VNIPSRSFTNSRPARKSSSIMNEIIWRLIGVNNKIIIFICQAIEVPSKAPCGFQGQRSPRARPPPSPPPDRLATGLRGAFPSIMGSLHPHPTHIHFPATPGPPINTRPNSGKVEIDSGSSDRRCQAQGAGASVCPAEVA
jgi:hypothetical protein